MNVVFPKEYEDDIQVKHIRVLMHSLAPLLDAMVETRNSTHFFFINQPYIYLDTRDILTHVHLSKNRTNSCVYSSKILTPKTFRINLSLRNKLTNTFIAPAL